MIIAVLAGELDEVSSTHAKRFARPYRPNGQLSLNEPLGDGEDRCTWLDILRDDEAERPFRLIDLHALAQRLGLEIVDREDEVVADDWV